MNQTLLNILDSLAGWALKALAFLAIFIVGWIISRLVGTAVDRLLNRVGFNRFAGRIHMRRWTGRYEPSGLVGRIVYYALLLFTFQIAFNVFGPNPISDVIDTIIAWLPRLAVAAVIVVIAIAIANAVFDIVNNALSQLSYGRMLSRAAQIVIVALGAIAALNQVGVATTVTMPVLITILATIGGILVVGVGGGLIHPMRERWERMLNQAEAETRRAASTMRAPKQDATAKPPGDGMTQKAYAGTQEAARDSKTEPEHPTVELPRKSDGD